MQLKTGVEVLECLLSYLCQPMILFQQNAKHTTSLDVFAYYYQICLLFMSEAQAMRRIA